MDSALCADDNNIYTAYDFSRLPLDILSLRRRLLSCPECAGPAFFRKASIRGGAPCFGARPHLDGCPLAAPEYERAAEDVGVNQDIINNPGERIVVDFNFGGEAQIVRAIVDGQEGNPGRRGRFARDGAPGNARMHRRLSTLLRTLINVPAFSQSDQVLELPDRNEIAVRDFFVPLDRVTPDMNGRYRGFWGMLSDAQFSQDTLWFNSGGRGNISFCLSAEDVGEVYEKYGAQEEEDFSGAYILVIGTLRISQNRKLYAAIESPAYLSLRLE